jgi:MFS family permease
VRGRRPKHLLDRPPFLDELDRPAHVGSREDQLFGDWSLSTLWGTITDIAGPAAGTAFGGVNTVGAAAAFVASPLMGWLKQEHGWEGLFYSVAGVYLLAALCWLAIDARCRLWREGAAP